MKVIFALVLVLASSLAQAQESTLEKIGPQINQFRQTLLKAAMPYRRSLVVDELVEKMGMLDVDVYVSRQSVPGGALYFPGVILIGADLADLPREQMAFVLAHEYAHHTRMHWSSTLSRGLGLALAAGKAWSTFEDLRPFTEKADTPECSRESELDADEAAVRLLKSSGLYNQNAVADLLLKIAEPTDSDTHPGALTRINAMAAVR
jgi:Zn-dependent protease with chaperone function